MQDLFKRRKFLTLQSCFQALFSDERVGYHHHGQVVMEPIPDAALKFVSSEVLFDVLVNPLDGPPKATSLDQLFE